MSPCTLLLPPVTILFSIYYWLGDNKTTNPAKKEIPIYPLLQGLTEMGRYKNLSLTLTDDSAVVVQWLLDFQDKARSNPEAFKIDGVILS